VNKDLEDRGIQFLQDTYGKQKISFDELTPDDVVIIPAFGTTLDIEEKLHKIGITPTLYNTTCPFVEKVWNRGEALAEKGYSLIVHGKPKHEETRATFSRSAAKTAAVIVNDMKDTIELGKYITGEKQPSLFYSEFKGLYSDGFDVTKDLQRLGVINQTTQLATDTQAIADYLKKLMIAHFNLNETNTSEKFADTRDTLCYATNDNQTAVQGMLQQDADFAIVAGGYNSSNTSHLVELCEYKLPTYYINAAENIVSHRHIEHFNWRTKEAVTTNDFLPGHSPVSIMLTSGASCPDAVVEAIIDRLLELFPGSKSVEEIVKELVGE
jgi:4-hydroxy-3-methylbut-2-enyl diphosphate reductase